MKDRVYSERVAKVDDFIFDENVAHVFQDMISRSVPGYEMSLAMITLIAKRFAQPGTRAYDLGCSLGASLLAIASGARQSEGRAVCSYVRAGARHSQEGHSQGEVSMSFVGVDNAPPMLQLCEKNLQEAGFADQMELHCECVQDTLIENASIVVLNFTLQFIPLADRQALINRIYQGLVPGGVLLLSEKICFSDRIIQESLFDLHHDFKRRHGYSDLEISQKRNALEHVMIPETIDIHKERLKQAGFSHFNTWFQCFNFSSLLAIK